MYRTILAALAVALVVVLVGAGFAGGFLVAKHQFAPAALARGGTGVPGEGVATPRDSSSDLIAKVRDLLMTNYVEQPDAKKLERGAIDGMIGALGDPYTAYFDKQHYRFFKEQTTGEFYGVGIQIGVRNKQLTVIAPLDGTPAAKAGVKSGDQIRAVDGSPSAGWNVELAASKIRGERDSTVRLTLKRAGEKGTRDFVLRRVKLSLPNVSGRLVRGTKVGYIRIHGFAENVVSDVRKQMRALDTSGATSYVIDVRDNPGGLLQSGVDMASLFIDNGPLIIIKQRGGKTETLMAGGGADVAAPVVVLVNGGSASSSEIFAGAMQDRHRAKLVGEQTFGKAAVQTIVPVGDGAGLKVTTAYYLTPGGHNISKKGIKPDYVMKYKPGKGDAPDSQLAKAMELLGR